MRALARFAMRGPLFAAGSAAGLVLASLVLGILFIPAAAIVALTTLRFGPREGLKVAAIATSLVLVARLGLGQSAVSAVLLAVIAWLPAWFMAATLRVRRAQHSPLLVAAGLVLIYAVTLRAMVGDVTAFWREWLQPLFDVMAKDAGAKFTAEQITFIAKQAHGWSLVGVLVTFAAVILLARWWQAVFYNPGGFGSEFRELRMPRVLASVAGLLALAYAFGRDGLLVAAVAGDACVILVVLFALQGLAVIHFLARERAMAGGWLTMLYVMLMLVPQVAGPILATTGLADNIVDLRRSRRSQRP